MNYLFLRQLNPWGIIISSPAGRKFWKYFNIYRWVFPTGKIHPGKLKNESRFMSIRIWNF